MHRAAYVLVSIAACGLFAPTATAREQAEEFVAGLCERGLHELALDYLSQMETSRLADDAFRSRIPYHRCLTRIDQSRQTIDPDQRASLLDLAQVDLDQFLAAEPNHEAGAEALLELASVFVESGKQSVAEANGLPEGESPASERQRFLLAARGRFLHADSLFRRAKDFYNAVLEQMPKTLDPKTQSDQIELRQEYRGRLAQVSVLAAQAGYEAAATYDKRSPEFRKLNEATAKELGELFQLYSRWLVGFYARLFEGRCYQALEDYQRALGCYDELIAQPSVHPAFRKLIAAAYGYQAQCLLAQGNLDTVIINCSGWLEDARGEELESPEWLAVRFHLAGALQQKAESRGTKAAERRRLLADARDAYRAVADSPGEYQRAARLAMASFLQGEQRQRPLPRDFNAAYEAGKEAIASINAAKLALPSAAKNNPSALPELRNQMDQAADDARQSFRLALSLVDDDVDLERLNEVRYFLCWLYWESKDYYKAAVLGEFLARRYPEHPAAAAAAKIALASYDRLNQLVGIGTTSPHDGEFEARQMARIAEFIVRRWPGTQAAETSSRVLVGYAIRNDRVDEAKALLEQVSADARPALEAQLGNAMWGRYLELSQHSGRSRPDDAMLKELRGDAVQLLEQGVAAARKSGESNETAAAGALYLVQALLADGSYDKAVQLLEEPEFGPLAWVERDEAVAIRPEYAIEVYKAALRAYVSVTPPHAQQAVTMMRRLEQAVAGGGRDSSEHLARIYLSLAMSLDEQIDQLRDAGRDADADRLRSAFVEFLDRIDDRQAESSWAIRGWIAQAFFTLGASRQAGVTASTDQADVAANREYVVKARDAYRKLLRDAEQDPSLAPSPTAERAVRKLLGDCYRELGDYKLALDTYSEVLKDEEAQLSVQQAAALAYQQWGVTDDPRWLERAIYGGYQLRSTGKNRIWGWLRLALVAERAARSDPTYEDVFFEARLEAARCRFLVGTKTQGVARQQHFATAKQSIRSMLQLYPDLGGDRWRREYERLVKEIQTAAGDSPTGLQEFSAAPP